MNWKSKIITASVTATMLMGSLTTGALTTPASAATVQNSKVKVIWGVNLRTSPSSSASIVRLVPKGETVTVTQKSGSGWYKIKDSGNRTGYISSSSKYTKAVKGNTTTGSSSTSGSGSGSSTSVTGSASVEKVIAAGMKYWGTPYEFGASRNSTATFDCSSFVRRAFMDALGIKLPSDSRQQGAYVKANGTVKTNWKNLKRGDLMYFMSYKGSSASSYSGVNKSKAAITHTGIYLGNGKVLHTYSNAGGGVTISDISGKHWEYRFLFGGSAL
ncbi:C40 family peptidase [Paenibacillus sp. JNUCC31]|uniref:C40 family peptidase n=1 Tax=Paenibacillus sp. JNUCC-31 TaxID=2777983 RepID=UPI001781EDE9|nr:SH3 domain-containing C40 family peptidase [Paenibacillus sp. JNUCC-31]QOS77307.1 C40 family peptidase [Paenibacillus sp. JNUCC-31]